MNTKVQRMYRVCAKNKRGQLILLTTSYGLDFRDAVLNILDKPLKTKSIYSINFDKMIIGESEIVDGTGKRYIHFTNEANLINNIGKSCKNQKKKKLK